MGHPTQVSVAEVCFRQDLYPRIETNPGVVQQYAEDLAVLPPIEVNQHNELIDGWHRWTAHKKVGAEKITVTMTPTGSDAELLELAIARNAKHGLRLSQEDKRNMARRIYNATPERERGKKKKQLEDLLSVSERTVRDWLSRIDKDTKEARNQRIFDLWLACHTQEEIAEREGCSVQPIKDVIADFSETLPKNLKPAADHLTDFDPPLYNVWKFKTKSAGPGHPGNSESTILDNLLYLYTQHFDVVMDPFAGSGSTIDVCKKRFRRYWVSDRKPIVERAHEIRQHDMVADLPKPPRWQDVQLIYLDPPYWKQAEGKYSSDPNDLANMPLNQFTETLANIINEFGKKLTTGHIALLMQPTQWNAPEKQFTDHIADMLRMVKLPVEMRIQAPYESQQCTAQMVEWAKANKQLLVISREIIVWRTK